MNEQMNQWMNKSNNKTISVKIDAIFKYKQIWKEHISITKYGKLTQKILNYKSRGPREECFLSQMLEDRSWLLSINETSQG
jgi:hypothetical protein